MKDFKLGKHGLGYYLWSGLVYYLTKDGNIINWREKNISVEEAHKLIYFENPEEAQAVLDKYKNQMNPKN